MPRPSMAFYRGGGQGNLWLVKRSPAGVRMSAQAKHISAPHGLSETSCCCPTLDGKVLFGTFGSAVC